MSETADERNLESPKPVDSFCFRLNEILGYLFSSASSDVSLSNTHTCFLLPQHEKAQMKDCLG